MAEVSSLTLKEEPPLPSRSHGGFMRRPILALLALTISLTAFGHIVTEAFNDSNERPAQCLTFRQIFDS